VAKPEHPESVNPMNENSDRPDPVTAWRWPIVVLVIAVLVFLGGRAACRVVSDMGRAADSRLDQVADLADRFTTENITTTFLSALPRLAPDAGAKLELTAIQTTETLTRTSDRRVFFDLVPLGATVSEIRVPVVYRYHLSLDEPWRLEVAEHAVRVHAPAIRATLPPAIDTAGMEKRSSRGWLRFDSDDEMDELERHLTELLSRRAQDPDSIDLVRETCRRTVAEFVRNWLLAEEQWRSDAIRSVTVIFADESPPEPTLLPPTVELQTER
jgi:hypothetical protein